jgi:hypothetical protein
VPRCSPNPPFRAARPILQRHAPTGNRLAEDDDGGEGTDSRIVFEARQDGTYEIVVASFDNDRGGYNLTIREAETVKKPE